MSRAETIEQEYLVKSFEHFLFQVFEGGFDHIVKEDLHNLLASYDPQRSEFQVVQKVLFELEIQAMEAEELADTNDEQKINDVEETATNEF
jgi:hypothetical protein